MIEADASATVGFEHAVFRMASRTMCGLLS